MANPEHVEVVRRGKGAIADWRAKHPDATLDLSDADLSFANLRGADLSRADLSRADLEDANISGGDLSKAEVSGAKLQACELVSTNLRSTVLCMADLSGAELLAADLGGACLDHAVLIHANLSGASLRWTNLRWANFSYASLRETTFYGAVLEETIFGCNDMSDVRGLDRVVHASSSALGVDTLFRSGGKIPDVFLRGCGVPEVLIQHLPNLIRTMQPIQFYSCFISYSSKNEEFARRLHGRLEQEGLRVWFAPEDMRGGRKVVEQIDQAIRSYDRLLLVLSPSSMSSEWVRREIKRARLKEKQSGASVLFPIGLLPFGEIRDWECIDSDSGEDLAEKVREYHIPDFSDWKDHDRFEAAFAGLIADLRMAAER